MEPCIVSLYTDKIKAADIIYNIMGPPQIDTSPYQFQQSPFCNYTENLTLIGKPSFLIAHKDHFDLPMLTDLSLIGAYTVTIRAEIEVPDDYTKNTFTTMSSEHDFTVYVEPCLVSNYSGSKIVTLIEYLIRDPTLTDGNYAFEQTPACGYEQTVTIINLPTFATHNEADADFTVPETTDINLIGEYIVTVRSEIQVPTDHTKTTFDTKFVEYDFPLRVQPCQVANYSRDLVVSSIRQNIGSPSNNYGAYSFGENPICDYTETVTISNLPAFATHNEGSSDFTINKVTDLSQIGEYVVTIRSEICVLVDYTKATCTTIFDEYQFSIFIEPCQVSSYEASTTITQITYNIGGATLTDGQYAFDENPACGYPKTVTVTNLPAFVIHNEPSSDFTIPQTNDLDLLGEYIVTLKSEICVPDDYSKSTCTVMDVQYDFKVTIESCIVNTYSARQEVADITYNIGRAGLTNIGSYTFD